MLTVSQFVAGLENYDIQCIAGFKGVNRALNSFSIIDSPDILNWLHGGEFVVDCGFVTTVKSELLVGFISALKKLNCAALGIKLHRYHERIPDILINDANSMDFPLYQLPYEMRFCDFGYLLHKFIFQNEIDETTRVYFAYQSVIDSFCKYKSSARLLYDLCMTLDRPIFLVNTNFEIIRIEGTQTDVTNIGKVLNLDEEGHSIIDITEIQAIIEGFKKRDFPIMQKSFSRNGHTLNCILVPIAGKSVDSYFLLIPEITPVENWEYHLLNNISTLINICLNNYSDLVLQNKGFTTLFSKSVNLTEKEIIGLCKMCNFDIESQRICVTIQFLKPVTHSMIQNYFIRDIMKSVLSQHTHSKFKNCFQYEYGNCKIIYFTYDNNISRNEIFEHVKDFSSTALQQFKKCDIECNFGISPVTQKAKYIPISFQQTLEAISLGKRLAPQSRIYLYDDYMIYDWLNTTQNEDELNNIINSTIKTLQQESEKTGVDYTGILECYIKNQFNLSKTAIEKKIHRNTMNKYINQIKSLLPLDLDSPESLIKIQIALHAEKLLDI